MISSSRALLFAVLMVASVSAVAAAPAVGDTYVYRVTNGYNQEVVGQVTYRVDVRRWASRIRIFSPVTATGCAIRSSTTMCRSNTISRPRFRPTRRRWTPENRGRCA